MSDDGYTLAEAMAALVMVGLAIGGIAQASFMFGKLSRAAVGQAVVGGRLDRAQTDLAGFMSQAGPVVDEAASGFDGAERTLAFDCGDDRCSAELASASGQTRLILRQRGRRAMIRALGDRARARFVYLDERGVQPRWPSGQAAAPRPVALRAVALVDGDVPLAVAPVWARQPATCGFDSISGDCRPVSP
ncbi:MAG: hypothetical protein J7521_16875 [Caulobacter sp.]|nr:hypothetical protein [Caulobacter sp.]